MRSRLHVDDAPLEALLATYVRDHLAAAAGGAALARRAAGTLDRLDPEDATTLSRLAQEIGEERRTLRRCARALDIRRPRLRELGALIAERLGRVKLNGQLLGTSSLSPILEIDLLITAVSGKGRGWRTLAVLAPENVPADIDLMVLEQRSIEQRGELEALQDRLLRRLRDSAED